MHEMDEGGDPATTNLQTTDVLDRGFLSLRRNVDVQTVITTGVRAHTRKTSVYCRRHGGSTRVAVVAGRKVGGAVQRNLAKRRLRSALAEISLPIGCDVVVIAQQRALRAPYTELRDELAEQLRRCAQRVRGPDAFDAAGSSDGLAGG